MVAAVTGDGTVLGRSQTECSHIERRLKTVVAEGENEGIKDVKDKVVTFFIDNLLEGLVADSMFETRRIIGNLDGKRINNCRISVSLAKIGRSTSEGKKASSENNRPQVFVRSGVTSDQLLHSKKRIIGHVEDEKVWKLRMFGDMMSLSVDPSSEKLMSQGNERERMRVFKKMAMQDEKAFNVAGNGNESVEENNDEGVSKEVGDIDLGSLIKDPMIFCQETTTKPEQARVNNKMVDQEKSCRELVFHSGPIKSKDRTDKAEPIVDRQTWVQKCVDQSQHSEEDDPQGFFRELKDKALKRHKGKEKDLESLELSGRSLSERRGGVRSIVGCKEFNEFIANCKLVDLPMRDKKFTWYGPTNRSCRLDQFLLDEKWFFGGGNFEQFFLKQTVSDHASVGFDGEDFHSKVKNLEGKVNELEEKGNVSRLSAQDQLKLKIFKELWEALRVQEEMWRQKSCIRWLALGDSDTSFFQKAVKFCSANEIIHSMFEAGSEIGGVVLKLDFSKAYDCVRWEFLMMILEKLGFDRLWRSWTWACVSSASVSVLVNGSPTKEFRIRRGLWQGDTLSSFLFIIVIEVLHRLFIKEEMSGEIKGIENVIPCPSFTHLQFADDTFIFVKQKM
ncbi:hypothetical protein F3Y22_tig00111206pilonHSYRG00139 [Hibiscus syriacus]|uniref:Reverse transcriptase domain-containing protein n=1 Tax=Hibiscus syriacus TaxID=106335 RepID=A0A6A2YVT7_HIBSY|nr:hypothetical protein F3Y22_tig00111206pilonHSYRG00139 [Hibiscus syriacus]